MAFKKVASKAEGLAERTQRPRSLTDIARAVGLAGLLGVGFGAGVSAVAIPVADRIIEHAQQSSTSASSEILQQATHSPVGQAVVGPNSQLAETKQAIGQFDTDVKKLTKTLHDIFGPATGQTPALAESAPTTTTTHPK